MTTIKLKNGSGAPLAGDLVVGEPALDLTNKRLYTEDSGGTVIEVGTNPGEDVTFADNRKAIFGAGSDLKIYHDGSDSYIDDTGTGRLRLRGAADIILAHPTNGETYATFSANGANTFYYDNAAKLATTSTGIDVTGTVTADGVSSDGNISMSGAGTGSRYVLLGNETSAYAGSLVMQAGGGSAAYGGSIIAYGHSHASKAGDIVAGISSGSGGAFRVNTSGIDSGGDVLVVEASGNVGIGTSSPQKTLDVKGTFAISNNTTSYWDFDRDDSDGSLKIADTGTERMRIDASGNLLVGTADDVVQTNSGTGNGGIVLRNNNYVAVASDGSAALELNRLASDGEIANFRKDGTTVGSIGTSGFLYLAGGSSGGTHAGIRFINDQSIRPCASDGSNLDNTLDLGATTTRFKNLYLSGQTFGGDGAANVPSYAFGNDTNMGMYRAGNNILGFSTSSAERMRIDGSGNLLVGTTGVISSGKLSVQASGTNPAVVAQGTSDCFQGRTTQTSGNSYFGYWVYNNTAVGSITSTGSSTAYNTSSDYRLKENVVPLTGATERVKQLNPSRFNFIADADTTVDGFLAHEVADVVPEAITGTKDGMRDEEYEVTPAVYEDVVIPAVLDEEGNEVEAERTEQQLVSEAVMGTRSVPDYQGIDQSKLVPLLVATIQELEARITALESN